MLNAAQTPSFRPEDDELMVSTVLSRRPVHPQEPIEGEAFPRLAGRSAPLVGDSLLICLRWPSFPEDPSGGGEYRPDLPQDFIPLFDPDTGGGGGNDVLSGPFVPMLILLCLLIPHVMKGNKHSSGTTLQSLVEAPQFPKGGQQ